MQTLVLPNTDLTVSRFCYGTVPLGDRLTGAAADAVLDAFVEAGGRFFDTAHCYAFWTAAGAGSSERALADYLRRRGLWGKVVVATKGGHPSEPGYRTVDHFLAPGRIAADLDDSLGRLGVDTIDLYWLHRDDPRVPVGETVDYLNREVRAGRIRYFGGSNWTGARLEAANAYAAAHGLQGFVASQPCWSLAVRSLGRTMRVLTPEDWQVHVRSGLPVIPYSPTARGFFASPGDKGREYDSAGNRERCRRVQELAARRGAAPNQVALAWLLAQPFPVIPILGTGDPAHLREALGALDLALSPDEVRGLAGDEAD